MNNNTPRGKNTPGASVIVWATVEEHRLAAPSCEGRCVVCLLYFAFVGCGPLLNRSLRLFGFLLSFAYYHLSSLFDTSRILE